MKKHRRNLASANERALRWTASQALPSGVHIHAENIGVVGPNDKILVSLPSSALARTAGGWAEELGRYFGEGRVVVIVGAESVTIVKGDVE